MAKFKVAVNAAKKIDVTDLKSGEKKTLDIGELKMHLYGLGKELSDFELALLGDGSLVHARSKTHDYRVVNATDEAEIPASPASNPTVANAMRALANSSCGEDSAPVAANSGKCYIEKQNGDWFYIGADNGNAVKEGPFRTRGEAEMAAVSDGLTVANATACNAFDAEGEAGRKAFREAGRYLEEARSHFLKSSSPEVAKINDALKKLVPIWKDAMWAM